MDYAMKKGISLSTLRRHIKSNKISHRIENGRYLLLDDDADARIVTPAQPARVAHAPHAAPGATSSIGASSSEMIRLKHDLQKAREEIAELKTLIALYEETLPQPRMDV